MRKFDIRKIFKKTDKTLICVLGLAIFFRFFRLFDFQYWSIDEEIFTAVVRQVAVNHKLILTSPNVAIAVSLGSFFHLLSAPVFLLAGQTASKILIAGSVLGVVTTLAVYKTGKEIGGLFVGRVAAFLYGSSFLVAFSDRRWWPLTPDPLLAVLSIFSVAKIIKGRYIYALLLAICASFAWHSDPSLAVIVVFVALSVIVYKIQLLNKDYLPAVAYLLFSVAPFFIFELRHPGAVTHPLVQLLTKSRNLVERSLDLLEVLRGFTRGLFLTPGPDIEKYFLYTKTYPAPLFSPLSEIITLFFLLFPLWIKEYKAKIVYLFLLAFILGVLVFTLGMGSEFHQHYFVVVWPAFFLLIAFGLQKLNKGLVVAFLAIFLIANLWTILFSSMRYPLIKKEAAVNKALAVVNDNPASNVLGFSSKPFALQVLSDGRYFEGIGGLFFLKNKFPSNLDYYYAWDWIYRAYSLYEVNPTKEPLENTIIVSPK